MLGHHNIGFPIGLQYIPIYIYIHYGDYIRNLIMETIYILETQSADPIQRLYKSFCKNKFDCKNNELDRKTLLRASFQKIEREFLLL